MKQLDILFINPYSAKESYQDLAVELTSKEPPFWSLLLAGAVRAKGFSAEILDCDAERLDDEQACQKIRERNPRLVCGVVYGSNPSAGICSMSGTIRLFDRLKSAYSEYKTSIVGTYVSAQPKECLKYDCFDFGFIGDGTYTLLNLLATDLNTDLHKIKGLVFKDNGIVWINPSEKVVPQDKLHIDLPDYPWELLSYKDKPLDIYRSHNWMVNYIPEDRSPFATIYTSLGCVKKCLRGNTLINTIYGKISIKELAEKYKEIGVYTYDRKKKKCVIAKAINIQKTGQNKKLVRVIFDDNSYIDCTPDHQFLTFKNGNQNVPIREYITEAQNLKPKTRVRAIRTYSDIQGYIKCSGNRHDNQCQHRMVIEYLIHRKLKKPECIHHKDHNPSNNHPDNLQLCKNAKEHYSLHPEIKERMRHNNPVKNMTPEWKEKIKKSITGLKRSLKARQNYSTSKKGIKNPNYKDGKTCGRISRLNKIPNHKVKEVIWLEETDDTYCMEVPGYNWFYANNVLVHNCQFCVINLINRTNYEEGITSADSAFMRYWPTDWVLGQIDKLVNLGVKNIRFADELFLLNRKYYEPILDGIIERGYDINTWVYARCDTVKDKYLDKVKQAGISYIALGIESASQTIRKLNDKGGLEDVNIRDVVQSIHNHDIEVAANFMVGFPEETEEDMYKTRDLALELNASFFNIHATTFFPGTPLWYTALENKWELPTKFEQYAFFGYDFLPLPTKFVSRERVLELRDKFWLEYYTNQNFLNRINQKFGPKSVEAIKNMTKVQLKRKILGD